MLKSDFLKLQFWEIHDNNTILEKPSDVRGNCLSDDLVFTGLEVMPANYGPRNLKSGIILLIHQRFEHKTVAFLFLQSANILLSY